MAPQPAAPSYRMYLVVAVPTYILFTTSRRLWFNRLKTHIQYIRSNAPKRKLRIFTLAVTVLKNSSISPEFSRGYEANIAVSSQPSAPENETAAYDITQAKMYHQEPPDVQSRLDMNPTLIVAWWCTLFSVTIILIRLFGRWIRTERLFREDWIMLGSMIPLMIRMGFVHVILIWGTNNTKTQGLTDMQIHHREVGSRLVLVARISYAAFIWIAKWTVLEFIKRLIGKSWAKTYEIGLQIIYAFLVVTYIGVVISTLSECHPFNHYWQVVPDPGPKCREGLVQLIVMGVCDMVTDVVLIAFPIPLVWQSSMRLTKKISLILLFLLSTILIAITAYRIPSTISRRSSQQYRSLLASLEILAAAGVSNAIAIGSFIRDKGVKKAKFRIPSFDETSSLGRSVTRSVTRTRTRSMTHHHWGSDEDLARGVGVSLPAPLRHGSNREPRLAEPAAPTTTNDSQDLESGLHHRHSPTFNSDWNFTQASRGRRRSSTNSMSSTSTDIKLRDLRAQLQEPVSPYAEQPDTPSKMGFFDVGGLVANPESPSSLSRQTSIHEARRFSLPSTSSRSGSKAFLSDIGGLLSRHSHIREEDEAPARMPSPARSKGRSPARSPMRFAMDRKISRASRLPSQIEEDEEPIRPVPNGPDDLTFVDVGGLLR
ncbi:hypothetical protein PV08_11413 [Exophiala spinifera]|uniref:Rhodopsin domain-containing protein n=1 Tax=Exophiala spinifera TaxID=91928 RepID=A0A0D2BGJ1_9EURO|nr:uncharacterized protein PV08_11413 [Exophiala spinifera]KIW10449.1 hypothetical protein PV08_11413 [Exophiala spinifera]